ncbi:hypothetical protein V6Z11_D03G172400 [Gossypium hirsutum]
MKTKKNGKRKKERKKSMDNLKKRALSKEIRFQITVKQPFCEIMRSGRVIYHNKRERKCVVSRNEHECVDERRERDGKCKRYNVPFERSRARNRYPKRCDLQCRGVFFFFFGMRKMNGWIGLVGFL